METYDCFLLTYLLKFLLLWKYGRTSDFGENSLTQSQIYAKAFGYMKPRLQASGMVRASACVSEG